MALKLEDQAPLLFRYLHDVIGEYYMSKSFGDSISTYLSVVVSSSEQDKRSKMQLLEKLNFQEEKGKVDSLLKAQGLEVKKNSEKILDLYCDFCAKMLMIEDKNLYYILRGVGIEGENCFECIKNITDESILHPVIRMMVKIKQEEIEKEVVLDLVWYNMRKKEEEAQKEKEAAAQEKEQEEAQKKEQEEARKKEQEEAAQKKEEEQKAAQKKEEAQKKELDVNQISTIQLGKESEEILNEKEKKFDLEDLKKIIITRLNSFSLSRFLKGCLKSIFSCFCSCFVDKSDQSLTKKQMIEEISDAKDYETINKLCDDYKNNDDIIGALKKGNKEDCKAYLDEMEEALILKKWDCRRQLTR